MINKQWMSVSEAARSLAVSEPRVRQLLKSQSLLGEQIGSSWVVDRESVQARAAQKPAAGRPLGPRACWALLCALSSFDHCAAGEWSWRYAVADRGLRHRLKMFAAEHPPSVEWNELLRRRAVSHRFWAHPDVIAHLSRDPHVSVGGARAVAASGHDLSPGADWLGYLAEEELPALIGRYALQADPAGPVVVMAIASQADREHLPLQGAPVLLIVAMVDLLGSSDSRSRHLALSWLASSFASVPGGQDRRPRA